MSDNFNVQTTQAQSYEAGGVDPNDPSLMIGDKIAANQLNQQNQAELVKQAIEHTKQTKMSTALDENGGLAAQKGLVPKAQVMGQIQTVLDTRDDLEDDEKQKMLANAEATLPDVMNSYDAARYITALREGKQPPALHETGTAFQADGSQKDVNDKPFAKGSWVQESADSNGNQIFVQSNEPSAEVKAGGAGSADKEWIKLGDAVRKYTQSQRGNMIMNTITRAKQALALEQAYGDNPPKQVLGQIYNDISSIMQGGVGTQEGVEMAAYHNVLVDLNSKLGYYSGHYNLVSAGWQKMTGGISPLTEILDNIRKTLSELINTAAETVKAQLEAQEPIFRNLIETDPQRFQDVINANMKIVNAGVPTGMSFPTPQAGAAAPAKPAPSGANNDPLGIRS